MDILGMILGWKWKVQRTRRRWDRLREHALEREGRLREHSLRELDLIEEKLRMLEEQRLSRRDRVRLMREVQMEMANTEDLLEKGEEWMAPSRRAAARGQQPAK
jgi:hypothetical protein